MGVEPWTVAAFKERRRQTWKANRYWWLLLVIGLIGFEVPFYLERAHVHTARSGFKVKQSLSIDDMTEGEFTIGLVSLVTVFAAGLGITVGTRRHYRCPRCDEMPMGSWTSLGPTSFGRKSGVEIFPSVCRNCGAKLRSPIGVLSTPSRLLRAAASVSDACATRRYGPQSDMQSVQQ